MTQAENAQWQNLVWEIDRNIAKLFVMSSAYRPVVNFFSESVFWTEYEEKNRFLELRMNQVWN